MRKFIYASILLLLLSSCYMANGSPSSYKFGVKDSDEATQANEWKYCSNKADENLNSSQKELIRLGNKNIEELHKDKYRYQLYENAIRVKSNFFSKCLYQLGYRFKAPLYWCLAQDGDNTRICKENAKYRN